MTAITQAFIILAATYATIVLAFFNRGIALHPRISVAAPASGGKADRIVGLDVKFNRKIAHIPSTPRLDNEKIGCVRLGDKVLALQADAPLSALLRAAQSFT